MKNNCGNFSFNAAKRIGVFTAILATVSFPALAQLSNQTGIAEPGRVQEELRRDTVIPQNTPDIRIKGVAPQAAPPGAEKVKFKFAGLRIEGATVYSDAAIAPLYKDKIGSEISLADVYSIASALTLKYRNDGYALTQVVVPPQTIEKGAVRLQVVEGFIDKVTVQTGEDQNSYATKTIKTYAAQIKSAGPVNVQNLERQLLLINDLPGVSARSILSPSKATPGAADLIIIVERKSYDALLSADDYGSRYLGPIQLSAAGTLNSWLGLNEAISGQFVTAPDADSAELLFGSLGYEMPVGPYGTKVSVVGSITGTKPGFNLEPFEVEGRSDLISLKVTQPFIRTRATNLTGRILFDWRNVVSSNNVELTQRDRLRVLRVGMNYQFLDTLLGVGANAIDLEVSHGLDILGGSDKGDINMSRPDGNPEFTGANIDLQRLQRITDSLNLLLEGRGQISSGALLASEEFAVGGISSARGFDPSEITGDQGVSGRAELQWKNPWAIPTGSYMEKYQLFGFYDAGRVWNDDATTSAGKRDSLNSTGAGIRMGFQSNVEADFALAFPLNREATARQSKSPFLYASISKKF